MRVFAEVVVKNVFFLKVDSFVRYSMIDGRFLIFGQLSTNNDIR